MFQLPHSMWGTPSSLPGCHTPDMGRGCPAPGRVQAGRYSDVDTMTTAAQRTSASPPGINITWRVAVTEEICIIHIALVALLFPHTFYFVIWTAELMRCSWADLWTPKRTKLVHVHTMVQNLGFSQELSLSLQRCALKPWEELLQAGDVESVAQRYQWFIGFAAKVDFRRL